MTENRIYIKDTVLKEVRYAKHIKELPVLRSINPQATYFEPQESWIYVYYPDKEGEIIINGVAHERVATNGLDEWINLSPEEVHERLKKVDGQLEWEL